MFVFLDGDDVLPPDFVEQKLASLRPDSPFAYGSIREFGEGNRFYKAPNWGEIDLRQANFCETASAVWKWAFEEAGRWRETAGTLWDWHLWLRASQLGEPARSESVLLYRVHSKSASRTVGFARADANFNELRRRMLDDVSAHLEAARRPLRVGLLWYAINLGGGDQVALNLIGGRPRGIEWSGLALMDIGSSKREMLEEAARHTYLAGCGDFCIPGTARFDHSRDAARFVASQSDVLITWGVDQIDEVLGEFKGKLIVLSQCSNWLPTARVNSAAPYDALFVAVSEAAAVPLYKAGAHRSRVHVIHNGSSARFTDPAQSREHVRRSLGLEPESIAVGFVGRICEEKNPLDVARAVSILKAPYRAVFVGEGPLAETIRREFPIAIVVDPTPYVGDVFNALDCFVLVSHAEGMSLSVIEAWLCATPVVATYVGAIPELEREHGAMAVTVDAGAQPSEIAEAIKMAISPHNRSKVEYARRVAVEKYSTEEMRNRWEKFLRPLKQRGV